MKLELLAPAGSYEGFEAALNAGADAVYLGGNAFGARAYAANLNSTELLRAVDTAHILGKKLYLTVNTLVKDHEFEALFEFLAPLYEQGLDAVIVQDTGVFSFLRENFPRLPIHASTQMTVTGPEGAALLEREGAKRVIPARELSIEEIRSIHEKTDLEIECFIHGALCYCYSGQCLMSSIIGGRSGNRGRCAQPCRLPYRVSDRNGHYLTRKDGSDAYALNTKDICAVSYLDQMADAGVTSFKIEGRMKTPEYTFGVVSVYRKIMDRVEAGECGIKASKEDLETLEGLFNREGFGKSYLFTHNGPGMMAVHGGTKDGKNKRSDAVYETVRQKMKTARCTRYTDFSFHAEEGKMILEAISGDVSVRVSSDGCEKAVKTPASEESIRKQLCKTGGTCFEAGDIRLDLKGDLFIPVGALNALRREALEALSQKITEEYRRNREENTLAEAFEIPDACSATDSLKPSLSIYGQECYGCDEDHFDITAKKNREQFKKSPYISASCTCLKQIRELIRTRCADLIYVPYGLYKKEGTEKIRELFEGSGIREAVALPYMRGIAADPDSESILRDVLMRGCSILVRNMEDAALLIRMGYAHSIRLDHGVYTMNRFAKRFWQKQGVQADTVPWELNEKELRARDNENSELAVYGRIPLMLSAQCLAATYGRCRHDHSGAFLHDRKGMCFPVSFDCDQCYNIIYNTVPVSLLALAETFSRTGVCGYRFEFTDEDPEEAVRIIHTWKDNSCGGGPVKKEWFPFTRGHSNRGVL